MPTRTARTSTASATARSHRGVPSSGSFRVGGQSGNMTLRYTVGMETR